MKHLTQFQKFDMEGFLKGKQLLVTSVSEYVDYETKKHLGVKAEVVIIKDDTEYKQKPGEQTTNRFEKFTIKLLSDKDIPINSYIYPVDVTAKVYGQYNDQLSVTAGDIKIAQGGKA